MNDLAWDVLEPQRSRLRMLAAGVDRHVSLLAAADGTRSAADFAALMEAWQNLMRALDLGPEPQLRACPSCARAILHEATRCRYCMTKSTAAA